MVSAKKKKKHSDLFKKTTLYVFKMCCPRSSKVTQGKDTHKNNERCFLVKYLDDFLISMDSNVHDCKMKVEYWNPEYGHGVELN